MRGFFCMAAALMLGTAAVAQVAITGSGKGLKELAGSETLVTIVVKERDAVDANQRITAVEDGFFSVVGSDGERNSYRFDDVKEVRVQEGAVQGNTFVLDEGRALTPEQRQVLARARQRALDIFNNSDQDQELKMTAATLAALGAEKAAVEYLRGIARSNDISTQLKAIQQLYLAGEKFDAEEKNPEIETVKAGLASGNRRVKATAADLSGLLKMHSAEFDLHNMFRDRAEEFVVPSTRALARLGQRDIIPQLLVRMGENNNEKADASIYALTLIGGSAEVKAAKDMLNGADQIVRFRIARFLYTMKDPMGLDILEREMLNNPGLKRGAALILARDGNLKASGLLRDMLQERFNPDEAALTDRAQSSLALVKGGDRAVISTIQALLRSGKSSVERDVCERIAGLGLRSLLTILQPSIESPDPRVAAAACMGVIATAEPSFRARLNEIRVGQDSPMGYTLD